MGHRLSSQLYSLCDMLGMEIEITPGDVIIGKDIRRRVFGDLALNVPYEIESSLMGKDHAVVLVSVIGNLNFLLIAGDTGRQDAGYLYLLDATLMEPIDALIETKGWKTYTEVLAGLDPAIVASYALTKEGHWKKVG